MKKTFLVGFTPLTRVVIDVPENYKAAPDNDATSIKIINAARRQILECAADKLNLENCDILEEDTEVPYDADRD